MVKGKYRVCRTGWQSYERNDISGRSCGKDRRNLARLKPRSYKGLRLRRVTLAGLRLRTLAGRILLVAA